MREIVHAGIFVEKGDGQYRIHCTGAVLTVGGTHRYRVAKSTTYPPVYWTGGLEEITCPECLEWARASEVIKHVQGPPRPMDILTGHSLDLFASAVGCTRYEGETDRAFRARIRREVG